jgi:hypothetical protein
MKDHEMIVRCSSSTVLRHLTKNPKTEGSNLTTCTGRENLRQKSKATSYPSDAPPLELAFPKNMVGENALAYLYESSFTRTIEMKGITRCKLTIISKSAVRKKFLG